MFKLKWSIVLAAIWSTILTVAVNISPNPKYSFEQCLISKSSLGYCVGISALSKLQSIDNDPEFDVVDGVTFTRDEQQPRTEYNFLERDPNDYGGIMDTISQVISYRTVRWNMGRLYPGLVMRVTPSVNGVLEFVLDPHHEDLELKSPYKEVGTARVLARQFLLPFLLGIKFKVATIIPIVFGVLALLAKKALVLSKVALVLSSSVALGSLLFGTSEHTSSNHHNHHYDGSSGYDHQYPSWNPHYHAYKSEDSVSDYSELMYKGYTNDEIQDQLKFRQVPLQQAYHRDIKGRNFAWNDNEKEIKS